METIYVSCSWKDVMKIIETTLPEVLLIELDLFQDERGFFLESYQKTRYKSFGIVNNFIQENHSRSVKNVLRGLHFQLKYQQAKLVRAVRGEVFDVAVDMRKDSSTFGRYMGVILSEANHRQIYIPEGFAHGFCVLSEIADIEYKCSEIYHPEDEQGIIWSDPTIGIKWPIRNPILSEKDKGYQALDVIFSRGLKAPAFLKLN